MGLKVNDILDCIIIGAGPAGLTAALYGARARLKIKIFEAVGIGGQIILTDWINNYPGFPKGISPVELMDKFNEQIRALGVEVDLNKADLVLKEQDKNTGKIFKVTAQGEVFLSRSLIIATGASPARLNIPGEREFMAKGVSYCATCDAPLFKGKNVVVVGGGNSAFEEAIFLSKFANKIYLIHRRPALRATAILQEQLEKTNKSQLVLNSVVLSIEGRERVTGIKVKNTSDSKVSTIDCDGVFIFVGTNANTELVKSFVSLDDKNCIIVDSRMCTSEDGVFACGDCVKKDLRQVITACSDGAQAAYSAQNYLIKY